MIETEIPHFSPIFLALCGQNRIYFLLASFCKMNLRVKLQEGRKGACEGIYGTLLLATNLAIPEHYFSWLDMVISLY